VTRSAHVARAQAFSRTAENAGVDLVEERRKQAGAHPELGYGARAFEVLGSAADDAQFDFSLQLLLSGARASLPEGD
jgi:hypothetical protein